MHYAPSGSDRKRRRRKEEECVKSDEVKGKVVSVLN
jgi:hypothetical protein